MNMVILPLVLGSILMCVDGVEVVGNYKFWDSISNDVIYDYSGYNNHGKYSTQNFYYTDRGIMLYENCTIEIPSRDIKEYPGYKDFTISYWYLRKNDRSSRQFHIQYNIDLIRIFFQIKGLETVIEVKSKERTLLYTHSFSSPDLKDKWRLYTFKVTQNSMNTESTITIYLDLNLITSYTITKFDSTSSFPTLYSQSYIGVGAASYLYGIIYEMWWHKDVSNMNDLDYLLISSNNCACSYGCVSLPVTQCLPIYDGRFNYQGQSCSPLCPESCNQDFECIRSSKAECISGLYHRESRNCLFYCPYNSCICSSSLDCSCKTGYKKVSDNPSACIPSQCIGYESKDYRYTCHECEPGYVPDLLGELCICDEGFTAVSSDPLICINIPRCLAYAKEGNNYICSRCTEGYTMKSNGICNECDIDYTKVSVDPLICIGVIEGCVKYDLKNLRWECEICIEGYSLDSSKLCKEDPVICEGGKYLSDGSCAICPETCLVCDIVDDTIQCTECREHYTSVIINYERLCILCSIDNPLCTSDTSSNSGSNTDDSSEEVFDDSNSSDNNDNSSESGSSSSTNTEEEIIPSDNILLSQASTIFRVFSIASIGISLVSMNPNNFFAVLGTTEILSFMLIYNIDIPDRVRAVIEGMDILQIIPNIFEYFIPAGNSLHETRYKRAGYESEYFLINSGKFLTVLLFMTIVYIILKLIFKMLDSDNKIKKYVSSIMHMLGENIILGYLIQMHLEITITSLLNVVKFSYRDAISVINLLVSLIVSLACLYAPIMYFLSFSKPWSRFK